MPTSTQSSYLTVCMAWDKEGFLVATVGKLWVGELLYCMGFDPCLQNKLLFFSTENVYYILIG